MKLKIMIILIAMKIVVINYRCTVNSSCPKKYSKLLEDKMECIKNDIKNIIEDLIINEKNETEKMSKEEEIEYYDNLIKIIEKGFTENYDTSKLEEGQDEVIKTEKMTVTFTTIDNQKSNINNNITRVDLGECETLLRKEYNISSNEILYMKKIDIEQESMKIPKVEYDVYCKLFGTNLIKLNLTICEKSKISIFIPIVLPEDLDKFNSSSGYYKDICYSTTSKDGTDIPLADRQKEFIDNNKFVCQEDCDFSEYNYITYTAECLCKVKESSQSFSEMNIDKIKLFENFLNIKNIVNFNFLICYKKLYNKESILNNIGCYIILAILLFHIITILIFNMKSFFSLKKRIYIKFLKTIENKKVNEKDVSKKHEISKNEIYIFKSFKKIYNKRKLQVKKSP